MPTQHTLFDPVLLSRPFHRVLARGKAAARLQILIYHRVLDQKDPLQPADPTASEFLTQMQTVAKHFNVLSLSEAFERLTAGSLPPRPLCITFDDGYADNYRVALPILNALNLTATVFVATDYLDGGIMFNDVLRVSVEQFSGDRLDLSPVGIDEVLDMGSANERHRSYRKLLRRLKYLPHQERFDRSLAIAELTKASLPNDLMMTSDQLLRASREGLEIGAHTCSHPILKNLSDGEARREIAGSRRELQERLDRPVNLFAYPNGQPGEDFTSRDSRLAQDAGFRAAVTTREGISTKDTNPFELRRFTPWHKEPWRFMASLLKNYTVS